MWRAQGTPYLRKKLLKVKTLLTEWCKSSKDFCHFSGLRCSPLRDLFPPSPFFQSHPFMEGLPYIAELGVPVWAQMLRCLNACSLKGVYVTGVVYRNPDLDDIQIFYDITASYWYFLWKRQKHQMLGFHLQINTILESKNNKDTVNISFSTEINQLQFRELH